MFVWDFLNVFAVEKEKDWFRFGAGVLSHPQWAHEVWDYFVVCKYMKLPWPAFSCWAFLSSATGYLWSPRTHRRHFWIAEGDNRNDCKAVQMFINCTSLGLPLHSSWQDGFYSGKLGFLKAVAFSIPAVLKLDQKPQNPVLKRNQVIFLLGQWPCTLVSSGWSCSKIRALTFLFPVFCLCVRAVSIHKKMANLWWLVVPGLGIWLILRLEKDLAVWFDFVFGLDPGDLFRPIEIFPSPRTSLAWIVRLK